MFLAQLQNGQEALTSYRTGIDILAATLVGSLMHLKLSIAADVSSCRAEQCGGGGAGREAEGRRVGGEGGREHGGGGGG